MIFERFVDLELDMNICDDQSEAEVSSSTKKIVFSADVWHSVCLSAGLQGKESNNFRTEPHKGVNPDFFSYFFNIAQ